MSSTYTNFYRIDRVLMREKKRLTATEISERIPDKFKRISPKKVGEIISAQNRGQILVLKGEPNRYKHLRLILWRRDDE